MGGDAERVGHEHAHDVEVGRQGEGASMGGGELFKATAKLVIPEATDIDLLETELEDLANDLMVNIRFT